MYLKAWLVPSFGAIRACFVAASVPHRAPASAYFPDEGSARAWVEREARELHTCVRWVEAPEWT